MKSLTIFFLSIALFFNTVNVHSLSDEGDYNFEVALVGIFQNEARFLREWIEFHKLVGVQHFYLYNKNSRDNYQEVLSEYVKSGLVDLIEWPSVDNSWNNFCYNIQPGAYNDALQRALGVAKWLVILDTDEFVFPVQERTIGSCLTKHFNSTVGIVVNWQLYGTSLVWSIEENELMIEKLVLKAPTEYWKNSFFKSIVRPEYVMKCYNPHFVEYKPGYSQEMANGQSPINAHSIYVDKIRINHYWARDEKFFYNEKIPRNQRFSNNGDYDKVKYALEEELHMLNQINDDVIFRFVPELKMQMGIQ